MTEAVKSKGRAVSGLVISYLTLRRAVGVIGISLPFVLVLGRWLLDGWGIQPSMSAYYYSGMRDVFVGSICATGVFLVSYRGYERADDLAGNLACVFAVGLALFPTSPASGASATQIVVGSVHLLLASAYFLTLAYFSLVLFRKTNPAKPMTEQKKQRNAIYTICGYAILTCIALVVVYVAFLRHTGLSDVATVFWLESTAVLAFGTSWLVKGEAILADATPTDGARKETEKSGMGVTRRGGLGESV